MHRPRDSHPALLMLCWFTAALLLLYWRCRGRETAIQLFYKMDFGTSAQHPRVTGGEGEKSACTSIHVCPRTTIHQSSTSITQHPRVTGGERKPIYYCMYYCISVSSCYFTSVLIILLYICSHTTICDYCKETAGPPIKKMRVLIYKTCVLILLNICPHTTICLSSYYYIQLLQESGGCRRGTLKRTLDFTTTRTRCTCICICIIYITMYYIYNICIYYNICI